jgi:hypothetical protein
MQSSFYVVFVQDVDVGQASKLCDPTLHEFDEFNWVGEFIWKFYDYWL